ncbi:LacI family DNA-binding transcriptional regulator [Sphingomonas sp. AR_OL41]|uniref:LacI family DNA-binding transcriptional regulator n=1 Tax=Sphingomonas sp. AR_OL41 TaxID=3042729 RepID=UPI002481676E|nr:LacI family DNA-binding transcriptional regulator [Sphingomonas sp. AR_OL41]MDH7974167.1 LacI family DNA-binding transcriptional regulator [Sphingomonas sp. AR_OL41]
MNGVAKAPTLDDVATLAGVSPATVSRFLNSPEVVAAKTADRIRAAIVETGYLPNLTAGTLAGNRSRLIAALVPEIAQSIFNDTVEAMIEELSAAGNSVMLALTGADNTRLISQINAALSRRVDAIILTGVVTDEATRARLRAHPVTVIETWGLPEDPIDVAIGFSHRAAGEEMAHFLRARGYRRPHLVVPRSPRSERRASSFATRWMQEGGSEPTRMEVNVPSHFGQGRLSYRALADLPHLPDVVVCGSDWIAQGFIVEAQAAGMRVPDQIAVTGFGNLRMAGDMRPTITSVDVDGARVAREMIRVLRTLSAGAALHERRIDVGFRIIARESA